MNAHACIVPVHNEAAHVGPLVDAFLDRLPAALHLRLAELWLVENGSTDGTAAACEAVAARHPRVVRTVSLGRASYGAAVRRGILVAGTPTLSILELDHLDATFVGASLERIDGGCAALVVGSKQVAGADDRRPPARRALTLGFNLLLRALFRYPGTDTHGLKTMRTDLARHLCALAVTSDEAFQTELVLIAWRLGVPIGELPIAIRERRATPVRIRRRIPVVLRALRDLRRSLRRFDAGTLPALPDPPAAGPRSAPEVVTAAEAEPVGAGAGRDEP